MNPVDHPMGGGEGSATGGHPTVQEGYSGQGLQNQFEEEPFQQLNHRAQKEIID
jgi:ribosomal protein L2